MLKLAEEVDSEMHAPIPLAPQPSLHKPELIDTTQDETILIDTTENIQLIKVPPAITYEVPAPLSSPLLEDLDLVESLKITRQTSVLKLLFPGIKKSDFQITSGGVDIFTVEENSNWSKCYFFSWLRPFQLRVLDHQGIEVMRINRPFNFTSRFMPCFLQEMVVYSPPGNPIGTVNQVWSVIKPNYVVKNESGETKFHISGPLFTFNLTGNVKFKVTRPDGVPVGTIQDVFQGPFHNMFFTTMTTRLEVLYESSVYLPPDEKALLMSASLLFNYMYYDY